MNKKDLIILVVLVVLSAISVLNFKVYGQDFDRPVASELTISPSCVDIGSGGVTVTLSVQVSDVSAISITNGTAGYLHTDGNVDPILNNDTQEIPVSFPPYIQSKRKQTFKAIGTAFNCSLNLI